MQILPAIDLRGGQCVRLRQGDYNQETVFSDDPVAMANTWQSQGAHILHLVDLDGAKLGQPVNHEVVRKIVETLDIPCQLGGGIRNEDAIKLLLEEIGVSRAIVGTAALKNPEWFREMAGKYPGQLCLGLDAKDSMVATEGWLDVSETSAVELARQYVDLDLPAVIYTNIANDGMMQGIDEQTIADMIELADMGLKIIASGGVTTLEDIRRLKAVHDSHPNLTGVITGRAIYEGAFRVSEAVVIAEG
jgi:phosphoribosylformimino-5-aminoimidazole carboxamide ribotide isomerase